MISSNESPEVLALAFTNHTTLITRSPDQIQNFKQSSDPVLLLLMDPPSLSPIVDLTQLEIRYTNYDWTPARIQEIIDPPEMTHLTHDCIRAGRSSTFIENIAQYIRSLPSDDTMIIIREYQKYIEDGTILDGFVAGVAAYIALLVLNENGAFTKQLPFHFGIPCMARTGHILTQNMFHHVALPLVALTTTCQGCILGLVKFVQGFINMWDAAFNDGPVIDPHVTAMMQTEIVTGISQYTIRTLGSEARHRESIETLRLELKSELNQMRHEVQKTLAEMRETIAQLSIRTPSVTTDSTERVRGRVGQASVPADSLIFEFEPFDLPGTESHNSHFDLPGTESHGSHFDLPGTESHGSQFELRGSESHSSHFDLPGNTDHISNFNRGQISAMSPLKSKPYRPWQQRQTLIITPEKV